MMNYAVASLMLLTIRTAFLLHVELVCFSKVILLAPWWLSQSTWWWQRSWQWRQLGSRWTSRKRTEKQQVAASTTPAPGDTFLCRERTLRKRPGPRLCEWEWNESWMISTVMMPNLPDKSSIVTSTEHSGKCSVLWSLNLRTKCNADQV